MKIKKLFPEFHQKKLLKEDLLDESKNIIVFDTNYFLDILRNPISISAEYINAFEKVISNAFIPYLVALEFHMNKSIVKKEKEAELIQHSQKTNTLIQELKEHANDLPLLEPESLEELKEEMNSIFSDFSNNLLKRINFTVEDKITGKEDDIYEKLLYLMSRRVGQKYSQMWVDQIQNEGVTRYEAKIPPGYNDEENKNRIINYDRIEYNNKFGDLIIWKDIIKYANESTNSGNKIIMVTNDGESKEKNDVIFKVNSFKIGPRIELMHEMYSETGKEFHLVNNFRFVQLVNEINDEQTEKLKKLSEKRNKQRSRYEDFSLDKNRLRHLENEILNNEKDHGINFNEYSQVLDDRIYRILKKYKEHEILGELIYQDNYKLINELSHQDKIELLTLMQKAVDLTGDSK